MSALRFSIVEGHFMRNAVATIAEIAEKAIVHFSPDRLLLQVDDDDTAAVTVLRLQPKCFERFDCETNETASINLTRFNQILQDGPLWFSLTVYLRHGPRSSNMEIYLFSPESKEIGQKRKAVVRATTSVTKCRAELRNIEEPEYQVRVSLRNQMFREALQQLKKKAATKPKRHLAADREVAVEISQNRIEFSVDSGKGTTFIVVLEEEKGECGVRWLVEPAGDDEDEKIIHAKLYVRRLDFYLKALLLSNEVNLYAAGQLPTLLKFRFGNSLGHVLFYEH